MIELTDLDGTHCYVKKELIAMVFGVKAADNRFNKDLTVVSLITGSSIYCQESPFAVTELMRQCYDS